MKHFLKKYTEGFINLLYPLSCFGCEISLGPESNVPLCSECFEKIKKNPLPYCKICGRSMNKEKSYRTICNECTSGNFYFTRAWSCCIYEGIIKDAILRFKYTDSMYLAPIFREIFADFIKENLDKDIVDMVVPVPLFSSKQRERGFNQSNILADLIRALLNKPVFSNMLKKIRPTRPQQELNRRERLSNLKGAFVVRELGDVKNKNIMLVDDVLTTGSTINECSRILKEALCKNVFALTLARGI